MSRTQFPSPSISRSTLRLPGPDEVVIAVMGATGSGKSSFINMISNSELEMGHGLRSCTASVARSQPFEFLGKQITLIDTPGFDDTTISDTDILKMIALYLSTTYERGCKLSGVIYMHRISDFRMGGASRRNFNMFRNICGDEALQNVVIATNMWGEVTPERGAARERELATDDLLFQPVLARGAQMLRYENSKASAESILRRIVFNQPLPLRIQKELVDEGRDIADTSAGKELTRFLDAAREQYRRQLEDLKKDLQEALETRDTQARIELQAALGELEEKIAKDEVDRDRLSREFAEDKGRADDKLQEVMAALRREELKRAAREQEIGRLLSAIERDNRASEVERQQMMHQLEQLRNAETRDDQGGAPLGIITLVSVILDVAIFAATGFPSVFSVFTAGLDGGPRRF